MFSPLRSASLALFAALLCAARTASALVSVCPKDCSATTIQGAINLVLANERAGSADPFIAVAGVTAGGAPAVYSEALTIDASNISSYDVFGTQFDHAFVQIFGDYDALVETQTGQPATVSALSHSGHSVLSITGNSFVSVVLNQINFTHGSGVSTGGGIAFSGSGTLDLSNVDIFTNGADFGGGIYANGTGAGGITLTLHSGTIVESNFANFEGGGIRIRGDAYLKAVEPQILIFDNEADSSNDSDGVGGGVLVLDATAVADIGSPGFSGTAVVQGNRARRGAGVAIQGAGGLRLFSTAAGSPARIEGNTASQDGGGLLVEGKSFVCASGYGINNNTASNGAGIFVDDNSNDLHMTLAQLQVSSGNAGVGCGKGHVLPPIAACAPGSSCNAINLNLGAQTVLVGAGSNFIARRFEMRRNLTTFGLFLLGSAKVGECLLADNSGLGSVVEALGSSLEINGCTLANNATGVNPLIDLNAAGGALALENSILFDPARRASVRVTAGSLQSSDVLASETASLTAHASSNVRSADPRFVDAANGDYHLKSESPAVDYHLTTGADFFDPNEDIDGNVRGKKLLKVLPVNGSGFDIGAYELQSLGDLLFVDGFDGIR